MSSTIDKRIVQMQFDNRQFESGIKTSTDSLARLSKSLKLEGATKGLSEIDRSAKSFSRSGLAEHVEGLGSKFTALGVIGVTALMNITNSAVNAGTKLAKALTIDPVSTGFSEYETKMNAIQTILTNTASKGTTMDDVTKSLDELNKYADQTIYNFADMTKNIGTFTAAGVDLDKSVSSIKGIANLAAGSGSTPQQASTAMYQLSQALAAGKVSLMDWNSVVNAGMGGELFQNALKDTAKEMGKVVDEGKPFRETLKDGWLTTDVLTKTLNNFAEDPALVKAATEVKTVTQLLDTMKESVQSGWAVSWEKILGNKDQAAKTLTAVSEGFNSIIGPSTEARNNMLDFWNANGGREAVIQGLSNVMKGVGTALSAIGKGFKEVFPSTTGKQLVDISEKFKALTKGFKLSDETANDLKRTFKGLFSFIDIIGKGIFGVVGFVTKITTAFTTFIPGILGVTAEFGDFVSNINKGAEKLNLFSIIADGISSVIGYLGRQFSNSIKAVDGFFDVFRSDDGKGMQAMSDALASTLTPLEKLAGALKSVIAVIGSILESVLLGIGSGLGILRDDISGVFQSMDVSKIVGLANDILGGSILLGIKKLISSVTNYFSEAADKINIFENVNKLLTDVKDTLVAYQDQLKAGSLLKIAGALGILAGAMFILASIDPANMETALVAITILFAELFGFMLLFDKIGGLKGFLTTFKVAGAFISLSVAILILTVALERLAKLDMDELGRGLLGIAGIAVILAGATKVMTKSTKGLIKNATGLVIFAVAIGMLTKAVMVLGGMDADELTKGLIGVGVMMAELAAFMQVAKIGKMGIAKSIGILILAGALNVLAFAVKSFGEMNVYALQKGLGSIAIVLLTLAAFMKLSGNANNMMITAIGLTVLSIAMLGFTQVVESMGKIPLGNIVKGLLALAGILTILAVALRLLPTNTIASGMGLLIIAGALTVLAKVLDGLGGKSWEHIGKSLVTLAGALIIVAVAMRAMSGGILGAVAMTIMAGALAVFVPQLLLLSRLNLAQIGVALLALAGGFTVIGVATMLLTPLIPAIITLAGGIALLGLACMGVGAGIALFATALTALAATGVAGGAALIGIISGLLELIPMLGKKIAEGLLAFAKAIGEGAPALVTAFVTLLDSILNAIVACIPKIVTATLELLTALLNALVKYTPRLVEAGTKLILALLTGLLSSIGKIVVVGVDIVVKLIKGISDHLPRLIDAGFDLIISFINGLAEAIRGNTATLTGAIANLFDAVIDAGIAILSSALMPFRSIGDRIMNSGFITGIRNTFGTAGATIGRLPTIIIDGLSGLAGRMLTAGSNAVQGFINGLISRFSSARSWAANLGSNALSALQNALGINSPSKEFMKLGVFSVEGFIKGVDALSKSVTSSFKDVGESAISALENPMSTLADIINGDIDGNPTITPVLDLSNVKTGANAIGGLLSRNNGLSLATAGTISSSIRGIQNGGEASTIVSAIKGLRKDISNMNNTTYQVNGITYDDGSNIKNAVQSLVRASKIERRI